MTEDVTAMRHLFSLADLETMPRIAAGQADDLVVQTELDDGRQARVWLSRTGRVDGEPWDRTVTLEVFEGRRWGAVLRWNGEAPDEYEVMV